MAGTRAEQELLLWVREPEACLAPALPNFGLGTGCRAGNLSPALLFFGQRSVRSCDYFKLVLDKKSTGKCRALPDKPAKIWYTILACL